MTEYLIPQPRPLLEKGVYDFYEVDDLERYNKHKSLFGKNWVDYWKAHPISYKINSLGYRMNEIEEIDQDNYIVTLGCSHTFGLGLPLEETWAYKLSKHLGSDLVNGGMVGTSNELILMNLIRVLANLKKPKLVVVNFPSVQRKMFWEEDKLVFHLPHGYLGRNINVEKDQSWFRELYKSKIKWQSSYDEYLLNQKEMYSAFEETKNQIVNICKIKNVPLIMLTEVEGYESYKDIIQVIFPVHDPVDIYERARDWCHYGINFQNKIIRSLIKNGLNV